MNNWRHRFRVYFEQGTKPRDITAQTEAGALRTAGAVERMLGTPRKAARGRQAEDLGHIGTDAAHCPRCRAQAPGLFEQPAQAHD